MDVIKALLILAGLVVVHEAGHFFAATLQGIRVSGFSVGFGPALIERHRRGVTYALRAIPLGGFVAFPDDDEESTIPKDDPDLLSNRPLPQRALVIAAGVLANLLLAWCVLVAQGAILGLPSGFSTTPGVLISAVSPGQAAAAAGLAPGDRIVAVNGESLGGGQVAVKALVTLIKASPSQSLVLGTDRGGQAQTLTLTPRNRDGIGRIGAELLPSGQEQFRRATSPLEVIHEANHDFTALTGRTIEGFTTLITHFGETAGQVSGPVKIVEMGAQLSRQGGNSLFLFTALISINLAVLNALPLPLLDGGQMVLLLLEGVRGRRLPQRFETVFLQSGFVFLVGLSALLIVKDTSQLPLIQQLLHSGGR